jgi:hypothetical protein
VLVACALVVLSGGCNASLVFHNQPGTGGGTMVNTGDGGAIVAGTGGASGTGGVKGMGGVNGMGGANGVGGVNGMGGAGPIDARMDVPRDVQLDVRDTGPDTNGPIVCTSTANCRLSGLVCLTTESRCVECVAPADCPGKFCDTVDHRCVECNSANDCLSAAVGEIKPSQCTANHHCLNGCDDSMPTACPSKPGALVFACTSFSGGVSLCVYCTSNAQCAPGQTCTADHACVTCTSNASCGGATPFCDTVFTGRCVACLDSRNCTNPATPLCDPVLLTCVSGL